MINKFFKTIHNKHYKIFTFIFFLRYLFAIFFIAITSFLTIPYFFDYEKKKEIIKNRLSKDYNFEIDKYEKIVFKPLPYPSLELKNAHIKNESAFSKFEVRNLKIFPKLFSIYNFDNFQISKIVLNKSIVEIDDLFLKSNLKKLFFQKKKLLVDNLDLKILDKDKFIVNIENLNFVNYGYNKNLITGKIFNKKFKIKIDDNFKNINFKLLNSGFNVDINFDKDKNKDFTKGILKSKILTSNLKFNFEYNGKILKIYNSYFRNKSISFNNDSMIILSPYLYINNKINLEEIDLKIFQKFNIEETLVVKDFLKKINGKNEINYQSKKFGRNLIDEFNIKIDLAYGRLNFIKKVVIAKNIFQCIGDINILEDYPLLFYNCSINLNDKKNFFKKFSLKINKKNEVFNYKIKGNLNILSKKINFKEIKTNENYVASKEDLKYFKNTFETIFFDENFLKMFSLKKIKDFIIEIS